MDNTVNYLLDESEMPTQWYNIILDLPEPPPPPLNPVTHFPIGSADVAPLFPMPLIMQEVSTESEIDIPGGDLLQVRGVKNLTTETG
ncbi:MAG: hypothetical protein QGD89_01965, partial [Actinomycetota bacterium]|nr:hypothetical protein [Actinomycetota bacterium]